MQSNYQNLAGLNRPYFVNNHFWLHSTTISLNLTLNANNFLRIKSTGIKILINYEAINISIQIKKWNRFCLYVQILLGTWKL